MAWLSSFLLYGFGELIESAQDRNGKIDIIKYLKKEQIMLQHDQMAQIKRIAKEHTNREVVDLSQSKA